MHTFHTERRIEFVDTDMGGIVHFSRFFIFMETAEHLLLEELGTSVSTELEGERIGWPRVAAECRYESPARFGERLAIEVRVRRKGRTSMTYEFTFRVGQRRIATGKMTSVCCVLDPTRPVRPIPIPGLLADKLEEAPE